MRFEKLIFLTEKLEEMREFYTNTLGLALIHGSEEEFTVAMGFTDVSFRKAGTGCAPFYHFAINIPRNQMREAKRWITSKVKLNTEDGWDEIFFKSWNAEAIYFEDPAGNVVEFIARHNLENEAEGEFTSQNFVNVSEIGIVTEDVASLAHAMNCLDIPNWRDGEEGFAPVGDEEGLFIIVKNKRRWYFSERKAGMYPLIVKVQGLGTLEFKETGGFFLNESR